MLTNRMLRTIVAVAVFAAALLSTLSAVQPPKATASPAAAWAEFHDAELALHSLQAAPATSPATSFMGVAYLQQRLGERTAEAPAKSFLGAAYLQQRFGEWTAKLPARATFGEVYLIQRTGERASAGWTPNRSVSYLGAAYLAQRHGEWASASTASNPEISFLGAAYLQHRKGEWLTR